MTNTPSIDIKNLSGQTVATAVVTEQAILHEELMAADYVQLSWNSDTGTTLPAGAYITVDGERYSLLEPYEPTRANEAEYQYAPQFQSRIMGWQKHPVPLYTYEEDGSTVKTREFDWDFTGSPADAMYMVQQAIKNETGEQWTVQLADSLPATISLSSQSSSIYAVLTDIANQCETEWWGDKQTNTLYLAQCKHGTPVALTVGGNVGVPTVTAGKDGYFTRFYVFGSSRNVTQDSGAAATNSTVNRRLTLDPATYPGGYIDTKAGLQPGEIFTTTLYFDDIYPSAKLSISDVRARLKYRLDSNTSDKIQTGTDDDGNPVYEQYAIWYFRIAGFDFDPDSKIPNLNLSAHFETGQLAGRDFELTYYEEDDNRGYTDDAAPFQVHAGDYEIMLDESEGITLPGLAYIIPQDGDQVILYNIEMPAEYTASARQELAEAAQAEIARRTADNNSYEMDSYPHTFATDGTDLTLGQAVAYTNGGTALSTRVLMVEKHLDFHAQQRIRVGNAIIKGNTQQLKEEVTQASQNIDILAAFNELSASLSNAYAKAQREMIEGFAAIKNMWKFDPDDPTVIYSDYSAYVNGYLSAKGNNPESGSSVSGASALVDLSDVAISNPQDGQILSWNGTKWVNADAPSAGLDEAALAEYLTDNHYAKTTDIPSLEGYATQTWASGQFALKTVAINAGTGLTGGGTLSASRTLSLATVGTAGTYTKVTVDAYGRVTGHGSLAAGDIPALAISKITGLQDALDAKMDADDRADFLRFVDTVTTDSDTLYSAIGIRSFSGCYPDSLPVGMRWYNYGEAISFPVPNGMRFDLYANHHSSSSLSTYNRNGLMFRTGFHNNTINGWRMILDGTNYNGYVTTLDNLTHAVASDYIQVGSARLRYDSANNALYVQKSDGSVCGFYATGFVSAKGANGDAGSVVEGASALSELDDVTIASPVNGQALVYRNGTWKNETIETGMTSVSWEDVEGKPTWIGSTKPTYTAAEVGALTQDTADGRYIRQNLGYIGNNADLDDYTGSGLYVVSASSYATIGNFPTESAYGYGTLVSLMFAEGRGVQWYIPDYNRPMAIRQAWKADEWQGWTYLLTHRNYTTYTVTKTGGGASGTWGIGITGNAGSATKLQTARTIALSGAVSGSATFDGSAGVTLSTTFNAQSLLTSLKTVDGSGCGLDADMLDGYEATDFYRKKVANAVSVSKALSDLVAENGSADAWNSPSNSSLFLKNNNNALSFYVGGTQNERTANIQAGHSDATYYANILGTLYLNRLGGNVCIGNPDTTAHRLNVDGGICTDSYIQVGSARLRYDSANNALYVQKSDGTQCGFYATGFVSAKGANGDAGSVAAGVTELSELDDVAISSPANGQALVYRNGTWKNETIETGLTSVSWDDVTGKPTWIGSTKPTYTAAEVGALTQTTADGRYAYKGGSNASGTWGISITGNAATATSATTADTAGNAEKLGGLSPSEPGNRWGVVPTVGTDGVMEVGRYIDFHYTDAETKDYGVRLGMANVSGVTITLPSASGTLARTADNVASATRLQTARTIWGRPFDGTANVTGSLSSVDNITMSGYLQIGSARLRYDSTNNALYVQKSDGTACGFYATGFVSAKGANGDGGASGDLTGVDSLTFTPGTNNRNLHLSANGMRIITTSSSGWATGITVYDNANTTKLGDVCGAYGSVNSFAYSYFGGPYNSPGMTILANKNVGIGTISPTYKLHVSGTAYATGGFQNGSDIRYKHVLQDLALTVAQVAAAPSFLFRWTDGTADGVQAGTSAQYWQQVMPQVVTESAGRLSMQYDKAALAAAIATARAVETLDQRVTRLEKENARLRRRLRQHKINV